MRKKFESHRCISISKQKFSWSFGRIQAQNIICIIQILHSQLRFKRDDRVEVERKYFSWLNLHLVRLISSSTTCQRAQKDIFFALNQQLWCSCYIGEFLFSSQTSEENFCTNIWMKIQSRLLQTLFKLSLSGASASAEKRNQFPTKYDYNLCFASVKLISIHA